MLVPYSWLKDYVNISSTPEQLADCLTTAGIEVERIFCLNNDTSGIYTVKIISVDKHPSADKLFICVVNTGHAVKTIITAATNVVAGAIVPAALPGAVLANGQVITSAELKGIVSEGMFCSSAEIGLGSELLSISEREGILILPPDTEVGKDIKDILALSDPILELSLTPNRSDCLSLINVARDVAAIQDIQPEIATPVYNSSKLNSSEMIDISITNTDLCLRYIGKVITEVKVGASPLWMQNRLRTAGVRPINNIVDISNFVMLEYGQPMHAFDYDLLQGKKIIVRNASLGEKIVTLDGVERALDVDTLVIADADKAVAIAGIMGGATTEVSADTRTVLFESACFENTSIRKNSRKLNLRSESSLRFEKGIDVATVSKAMERVAQLIEIIGCGVPATGSTDVFPGSYQPVVVDITTKQVNDLLGTDLADDFIEKTFSRLQFDVQKDNDKYLVTIPSYRQDITRMVDLVEEVARLYGYNNIPTTLPIGQTTQVIKSKSQLVEEVIVNSLTASGLYEVITYSFINPEWFDKIALPKNDILRDVIKVQNPLNEDHSVMRTTIVPGILETVQRNFARRNKNVCFFEIGKVFFPPLNPLAEERVHLAIVMSGKPEDNWNTKYEAYSFYDLKGIIDELFKDLHLQVLYINESAINHCHPGRTASIAINNEICGYIGEIHPDVAEKYDFPSRGYVCELDIEKLINYISFDKVYQQLPKYPPVTRDLALVVPKEISADEVLQVIKASGGDLLHQVSLFDVYEGEQITKGYKNLAFALLYQSNFKTLSEEDILPIQSAILEKLQNLKIYLR